MTFTILIKVVDPVSFGHMVAYVIMYNKLSVFLAICDEFI